MPISQTYALAAQLKKCVMQKRSSLGGNGNDTPFEEIFAKLAHSYLQDKAPSLLPYELGFQVVERNEDDTKALGVTGFKINGMTIFSPIFCINGEIKGHELLRLADQNLWVPLKEAWLNEIFRRKPIMIGEAINKDQEGISVPDLSELIDVPTKYGSYIPKRFYSIYRDIAQQSKHSITKVARSLHKHINPVNYFKCASYSGLKRLDNLMRDYPLIKAAFNQCHPGGLILLKQELQKRAALQSSITKDLLIDTTRTKKYANSVRFISYSVSISGGGLPLALTDDEKEKILRNGYIVQDDRDDDEVTKVIEDDGTFDSLMNPNMSGLYEVVYAPGKTKKMAVIRFSDSISPQYAVIDLSTHESGIYRNRDIWCTKNYGSIEYIKWVNSLGKGIHDDSHDKLVFLRGATEAYGPFYEENGQLRPYQIGCHCDEDAYDRKPYSSGCCVDSEKREIERGPAGSAFRIHKNSVIVPEDMKTVHIKDGDPITKIDVLDWMTNPGARVKTSAYNHLEPLKIVANNNECVINNSRALHLLNGLETLITKYGMREKTAAYLLKKAQLSPRHILKVYIKRGALETPPIPEVDRSPSGMLTSRIPGGPSGSAFSSTDSSDISPKHQITVDNDYASQDVAAVQQAIQSGQKDIFDVSVLKSLYTNGDTDSVIDEHVTSLTRAMTEAGDLLFQFYWKGDQFKDIYGPKNLPELEGNLKKLFEILGDVVLFLKRNRLNQADYEQLEPLNLEDNSK